MQAQRPSSAPPAESFREILFTTWSGRLIILNALVFAAMAYKAGTLGVPSQEILDTFGAKDPVAIVSGEWWRLITSMFVHIGLIHFLFNSYAINVIGRQIEVLLGMPWFIIIYLMAGFAGSISSAVFSIALSAGASGAIMGLLGCGLYVEKIVHKKIEVETGQKPRRGVYFINTIFILIFGLVVPNIDNAAHIGGLVAGYALGAAVLRLKPNRLILVNRTAGWRIMAGLGAVMLVGLVLSLTPSFVASQFHSAAESSSSPIERVYLLSRGLAADPENSELLIQKITTIVFLGTVEEARPDIILLAKLEGGLALLQELDSQLQSAGMDAKQSQLKAIISSHTEFF